MEVGTSLFMNNKSIGIFDSGIGGLTVTKEIVNLLPDESIIYLGDTARVPYGSRGKETITKFALQLTRFLLEKDVKFLVVACNTISAICLDKIQEISPIPVLGVIKPAVKKIVETTKSGRVGVIGTRATIASKIYEKEILTLNPRINVTSIACPLFVPIAEEGLGHSDISRLTAQHYLSQLKDIDTLHLGCTHYPLLKNVIREVVGESVTIIDSARPTAEELKNILTKSNLLNKSNIQPTATFYVTDAPERAMSTAELFFGRNIRADIHKVDLKLP